MRRTPVLRQENQIALALAEIERLKAIATRTTDGRVIVSVPGSTPGDGHTSDGDLVPLETSPHVLYGSKHTNSFLVTAAEGISLTIFIQAGQIWMGSVFYSLVETTLQMADATTNYVHINNVGVLSSNTTGFPFDSVPLAEVVAAGGTVTAVSDRRSYLVQGGFGGAVSDHGLLTGLLGDDHDIYALLAGRAGGQTLIGGTGAGEALILTSNTAGDGSVIVPDGLLTVGLDDTTRARIHLFGPNVGDSGGTFLLYLSGAHDAVFDSWVMDVFEDDLRFVTSDGSVINQMTAEGQFRLSGEGVNAGILVGGDCHWYRNSANVWLTPDTVVINGQLFVSSKATFTHSDGLQLGVADTTRGLLRLFGAGAGSAQGGLLQFHLAADHDTTFQYWGFDVREDDLRFFTSDSVIINHFTAEGQLKLSGQGSAAGLLLGGDVQWYRAAANLMATDDDLRVDGILSRARKPIVAKSGAYTITIDDEVIIADASGASFTITLPTAVGIPGKVYWIKKIDATANTVTVDANGAETIDDGLTAIIGTQYESITVVSDGTEWWVI